MKRVLIFLAALSLCAPAFAADDEAKSQLSFSSPVTYLFDNHEFAPSDNAFNRSQTIHYVVAEPQLSLTRTDGAATHKLVLGCAVLHNMGDNPFTVKDTFDEALVYYSGSLKAEHGLFSGVAGVYPRALLKGSYSEAMISDITAETDTYCDGMMVSWNAEHFSTELALDWMGMKGQTRKERFNILSAGTWALTDAFTLGWCGSFYHYAGSVEAPGVVDNHLLEPYVRYEFRDLGFIDNIYLQAGVIGSYQRDRIRDHEYSGTPVMERPFTKLLLAPEFKAGIKAGHFGIRQTLACGNDLLPFYNLIDTAGNKYGSMLYRGSAMYRGGLYSLTEVQYSLLSSGPFNLLVNLRFHAGSEVGFIGSQQVVSLFVNFAK
ncbi:MAG: hypothetical protein KBS55_02290 [Bacteroidales bacterium]|nr:hypothetical protein [Candidatus Cryptobacteroides aphodequi]